MNFSFDSIDVQIPCPKCGQKIKEKIGRLKRDKHITCPACGRIAVNADQLRRVENTINKELAKFPGKLTLKL